MARIRKRRNKALIPEATQAVGDFRYEMAGELAPEYESGYWDCIIRRECGPEGARALRSRIAEAEHRLNHGQGGFKEL